MKLKKSSMVFHICCMLEQQTFLFPEMNKIHFRIKFTSFFHLHYCGYEKNQHHVCDSVIFLLDRNNVLNFLFVYFMHIVVVHIMTFSCTYLFYVEYIPSIGPSVPFLTPTPPVSSLCSLGNFISISMLYIQTRFYVSIKI